MRFLRQAGRNVVLCFDSFFFWYVNGRRFAPQGSWNVFLYVVVGTFFCAWMEGFSYVDGRVFLRGWKGFPTWMEAFFLKRWNGFRT